MAALLLMAAGGCGAPSRTVAAGGVVTFPDGAPLRNGFVTFRPIGQRGSARGEIQPDGRFRLTSTLGDGAIVGEHQALVSPILVSSRSELGQRSKPTPPIDSRFTRFETSGLKFVVSHDPAMNEFVIQVSPPPGATPSR